MTGFLGALCGIAFAIGALMFLHGLRRVPVRDSVDDRVVDWRELAVRGGVAVAGAAFGWIVTGWPALALLGGAAGWIVPVLIAARAEKEHELARTDALATWAEMLRDTMASHAGIRQALDTSAGVAPQVIRADVQRLAQRTERGSLAVALRQFADEVAHPVADLIVAALVVAAEGRAKNLPELLAEIASSARDQASAQMRIETGRAAVYAQSRSLVGITMVAAVGLVLFSPEFMAPYDSLLGQLILGGVCATFAAALWLLVALSKPAEPPRLMARSTPSLNEVMT